MNEFAKDGDNDYLPLRDVVFNTLRQSILTGELKPGERLMEIHLADKLGVSRTPIREAIRKLELEGLVTMIPRRGAEVAQITEKHLKDVLEVRRALDALTVELACERITQDELADLMDARDLFAKAIKTKDANKIAQADVAFHDIILIASRNDRLMQMLSNLSQQMYRYRLEYVKDDEHYDRLIEEHNIIFDAISRRDSKVGAEAIISHIDNQEKSIMRSIAARRRK
ncbi:MAG: GntR family transcriptional regulator [Lachnospiraceae bacterium]|nr:GntR family transcriptional regulator [Lachnospiraceae bacterium]